ncbi:MAG: MipA/OmpV family protein [Pseudomonadota bacterium]
MKTLISALALAAMTSTAFAADAVFEPTPEPAPVVVDESRFALTLGAGVGFQPLYEGSDEYRAFAFPIIAPSFGAGDGPRRFEFRALDDARIHLLRTGGFSVGPVVGYRFGRDADDSNRLTGLGDIDDGLVVGGFVNYDFVDNGTERVGVGLAYSTQITGEASDDSLFPALRNDFGYELDLSAHYDTQLTEQLSVKFVGGGVYADDEYMQTNFGISANQAIASTAASVGLPAYDADAGIKNVYAKADFKYQMTENFDLRAGIGYSHLLNDAADSPITESESQFFGSVGAAYTLRF